MKTRGGVGADGWPSPAEARRRWGEDSFLSPKSFVPEPPAREAGNGEETHES